MLALYPGSFDPFHLGHLAVVEQVAPGFDVVVVAVVGNPQKASGMFQIPQRVRMAEVATAHLSNVRCVAYQGLTVDLLRAEGADVVIRCAHKDSGSERSMAAMNEVTAGVRTFFAVPDPAVRGISSSLVRELLSTGELAAAMHLVPAATHAALREWSVPQSFA